MEGLIREQRGVQEREGREVRNGYGGLTPPPRGKIEVKSSLRPCVISV